MSINAIAVVVGGFAAFLAIATLVFDLRRRKHKGVSGKEFIRAFSYTGTPEDIPEAVYKFYTRSWFFGNLAVAPDDSLERLLNKGEEDVEDDAALLMKKLRLKPPSEEVRLRWNEEIRTSRGRPSDAPRFSTDLNPPSPIQTVRDMVLWLDWVRQHQERDAQAVIRFTDDISDFFAQLLHEAMKQPLEDIGCVEEFKNRLLECDHSAYFSLKPLKGLVQKYRG